MGHWEDLMDLDSDPYVTPNSTMTSTSPSSETSWSDNHPITNEPAAGAGNEHPVAAHVAQETPPSDAKIPATEEDGDGFGSEPEMAPIQKGPRKISERRKAQNSKFESWLANRAEAVTKEQVRKAVERTKDVYLSTRSLVSKQESTRIVTQAREYQQELFERAKQRNIIAVLDTGSGKTLIAVLLLQHIIDQELEDRKNGKKPRISFFLVDCVTLVFQQTAVLNCNLNQNVEGFCGEMGCDLWDEKVWMKHFANNMVVVCTAEILHQCLMHAFIAIDQINLLIFDEAHHAKKNHPYARIIREFYRGQEDLSKRPKVFGMTASPVDGKQDVLEAAKELEVMLDCQIATAADMSMVRNSVSRPNEAIVLYERPSAPYLTLLSARLKDIFGDLEAVRKVLAFAKDASSQLGEWCSDHVLYMALKDEEAHKIQRTTERYFTAARDSRPVEQLDAELKRIDEARTFIKNEQFPEPEPSINNMSSKVVALKRCLDHVFKDSSRTRCIVFVKRRYTARLLSELFKKLEIVNMKIGLLIGTRPGEAGDVKISFRQQVLALKSFRDGDVNCLFATSIAEEGLDIPDCNVIIRFDLYDTLIQYIQSRGRARHIESQYIHMMEKGNQLHLQTLQDVRSGEATMRHFCEALPADRLLQGSECDLEDALKTERKSMQKYVVKTTNATLTYSSSLVVLAHYVSCLFQGEGAALQPDYRMTMENGKFICEVILPSRAEMTSIQGASYSRKSIAKRSAAFQMCIALLKAKKLDDNFISTDHKYINSWANLRCAVKEKNSNKYQMICKPRIWANTRGTIPDTLYLTVLELTKPMNLRRPSQPLALVTRTPMPDIPTMLLHLQVDKDSEVICTSISKSLGVTEAVVEKLNHFTLCMYRDLHNKTYEVNVSKMSYWLAPVLDGLNIQKECPNPAALIDWVVVDAVAGHDIDNPTIWNIDMPHSDLAQKLIVDRISGRRRFYSEYVLPDAKLTDPVPKSAFKEDDRMMRNVLEYSNSRSKKQKQEKGWHWNPDQPVLKAYKVPHHLDWLNDFMESSHSMESLCHVCPELMYISALPISVVSMANLFPAILNRIESHLITLEACDMLGITVTPVLALEAMTKDSENTEEHGSEQIEYKGGMGNNYERLEFLGDAFLKMATTISIFSTCPDNDEFDYHCRRMELICNKNLLDNALIRKLQEYIRTSGFDRGRWYPQGIKLLSGKRATKTDLNPTHNLGDKTIADVCEALIGAALQSTADSDNLDAAVKAVSVMVSHEQHKATMWSDYWPLFTIPAWQTEQATASQLDLAAQVERKLKYHFQYPRLLRSAFMHPSYGYAYERIPSYQRLEFLGDALLDMVCIRWLFECHPGRDPQWLTEHKMAMVSNKFLAALAVELELHRHLRCGQGNVQASISDYVLDLDELKKKANGAMNYWTEAKNPPKCLADMVESYLGAVFVDSKYDYQQIEQFFDVHIKRFFLDMRIYDTFANNHPVTHLHNFLTLEIGCMNYRVMADELPSLDGSLPRNVAVVMIHDEIVAEGEAGSGKNAKVKASVEANQMLYGITALEYRSRYHCDCATLKLGEEELKLAADIGTNI